MDYLKKPAKSTNTLWKLLPVLAVAIGVVAAIALGKSFAFSCSAAVPSSVSDRRIKLTLNGCSGTRYFSVSEHPDFGKSTGPRVQITNVAPDNSYADVSVTYSSGTTGGSTSPFTVANEQRNIKMLVVLFTFEDSTGETAGLGDYQTPTWAQRLMFGDSTGIGHDGYFKNYSVKDHLFQSSNGRLNLTGEVYPVVVHLPLEKYRKFLGANATTSAPFNKDILKKIEQANPGFLSSKKFDFLLGLSSEQYPVYRSLYESSTSNIQSGEFGTITQSLTYAIPVDMSKSIFGKTIQETRTSSDTNSVITRYNPSEVAGVWLESDTSMSGTNYYTGGSVVQVDSTKHSYIRLGSALPKAETQVVVRYKAAIATSQDQTNDSKVLASEWFPHFTHELFHEISHLPAFKFGQRDFLGDLYMAPAKVDSFDLMASGNESGLHPQYSKTYSEPSLLSASNKMLEGFVHPLTLNYGENQTSLRIYRAEYGDSADSTRTAMIKIPLRPVGDVGLETRSTDTTTAQYRGEEYLLLEWRSKGDLENEMHNFDRLLTSEGLVVYHVVEADPYGLTGHGRDIVRIIDATPEKADFSEAYSDTASSPVTFGPQSGVMSYDSGDYWQEKITTAESQTFEHLLSQGTGQKTLYIKLADADGNIIGTQEISTELTTDSKPIDRLPKISLDMASGTTINTTRNITASYIAPNGAKNIRFYVDGNLKWEKTENVISATSESYFVRAIDYKPGEHELTVVFYDGDMNKVSRGITFIAGTGGDATPPTVTIDSPASGDVLSGNVNIQVSASDNNSSGMAKADFLIDGVVRGTITTSPYIFNWDTSYFVNGAHTLAVKVYDLAGNTASSQLNVTTANGDMIPPSKPTGLVGVVSAPSTVALSWNANSAAETVASYEVYRDDVKIADAITPRYTDTTVIPTKTYSYSILAKDGAGNTSPRSDAVSVAIPALPILKGTIKGKVTRSDGRAVAGVKVIIKIAGVNRTTTTDRAGDYIIRDVPVGTYTLTYVKTGFKTKTVVVTVTAGNVGARNVTLAKS